MSEQLAEAVRKILDDVPASDRKLALKAGVSPATVSRIRSGERGCSPEVVEALAGVLEEWSSECSEAAAHLRRELQRKGETSE